LDKIQSEIKKNTLASAVGLDRVEKETIQPILDSAVRKGGIIKRIKDGIPNYSFIFWLLGMYELQVNRISFGLFDDYAQFEKEGFLLEYLGSARQQFRVIPIEQSVTPQNLPMPYEQIAHIVSQSPGPFAIFDCVCKKKYDMKGMPCKVTDRREMCMAFGPLGESLLHSTTGREISKDEALALLRLNMEEGLVMEVDNALQPEYVCSCCGCCCGVLHGWQALKRPTDIVETNWRVKVDTEKCVGCGMCVSRCQMGAISLVDRQPAQKKQSKILKLNPLRCIGCGLCVPKCKVGALSMEDLKKWPLPPPSHFEYVEFLDQNRTSKVQKMIKAGKALLGFKIKTPKK
jgi:ferredoxin